MLELLIPLKMYTAKQHSTIFRALVTSGRYFVESHQQALVCL